MRSDKEKNKWWRPTDYDPKYCTEIVDYFERCQAEILVDISFFQPNKNVWVEQIFNPLPKEDDIDTTLPSWPVKKIEQKLVMQRFPTLVRFARMIGVNKSTLYEWKSKHKEFSDSMEECMQIAEAILLENWLQWTYNSAFAQFLLKNNHWYSDKTQTELTGKDWWAIEIDSKQQSSINSVLSLLWKKSKS
jgi:hypothetical protein